MTESKTKVSYFSKEDIREISLPEKLNYPFYPYVHPLTKLAAEDLQAFLKIHFGEPENMKKGKMFGVLIVKDARDNIGYLSAFSGKLNGKNHYDKFVPPVFDILKEDGFFRTGEKELNEINLRINNLEKDEKYLASKVEFDKTKDRLNQKITAFKKQIKINKKHRKQIRQDLEDSNSKSSQDKLKQLANESYSEQTELKYLKKERNAKLRKLTLNLKSFEGKIEELKDLRKEKSRQLQDEIFAHYNFLSQSGDTKNLKDIFKETVFETPPAGAGECATPKLLNYAFSHDLTPINFAEFWWGPSPESEIRQHRNFYPACSGKCRPILHHVLKDTSVEENPILKNLKEHQKLEVVFEDESIIVVNKPGNLLSVPGIEIQDSVYTRLQEKLKNTEPLIVHRLDMSTSGLMVIAKNKKTHENLQKQFLERTVHKKYTALLSKIPTGKEGEISLPILPDILDRPRQKVDFKKGKKSLTLWKLVGTVENKAKVHFWPITGRTHQLRVHAAHPLGLNAPIVGDELYGIPGGKLRLCATQLEFFHPKTEEIIKFRVSEDF